MPHRALIITSDPKLRQDIENSLLELSLDLHHADGHLRTMNLMARYQDIWENDYDTSPDATLKFHVKELRKKLSRSGAGNLIETAWGIGYILRSDSDISP